MQPHFIFSFLLAVQFFPQNGQEKLLLGSLKFREKIDLYWICLVTLVSPDICLLSRQLRITALSEWWMSWSILHDLSIVSSPSSQGWCSCCCSPLPRRCTTCLPPLLTWLQAVVGLLVIRWQVWPLHPLRVRTLHLPLAESGPGWISFLCLHLLHFLSSHRHFSASDLYLKPAMYASVLRSSSVICDGYLSHSA